MKKTIRLTESDLTRIVKRVIRENKEQELISESLGDIIKKIKSKFSRKKEDDLESEIEENLGVNKDSTKEEVVESVRDFFETRKEWVKGNIEDKKEWIKGNIEDKKEWILNVSSSLGVVFRLFAYIVLFMGAEYVSDYDPITFLGIATYLFLQTRAKIGNKEFKLKN